jgi:hypothetical protein
MNSAASEVSLCHSRISLSQASLVCPNLNGSWRILPSDIRTQMNITSWFEKLPKSEKKGKPI